MRTDWTDEEFEAESKRREAIKEEQRQTKLLHSTIAKVDRGADYGGTNLTQEECKSLNKNWFRSLTGMKVHRAQFAKFYDFLGLDGAYPVEEGLEKFLNVKVSE